MFAACQIGNDMHLNKVCAVSCFVDHRYTRIKNTCDLIDADGKTGQAIVV